MPSFAHLIRFEAQEDHDVYLADLGPGAKGAPSQGTKLPASKTIEGLSQPGNPTLSVGQLLPPLPRDDIPIYCVGLNYESHAKEAKVNKSRGCYSSVET
jgi:2-keto-4-pentenoate hydratase/2-oxohepta-3-ene-1,7-dioic acid hydratase in catechol pathway